LSHKEFAQKCKELKNIVTWVDYVHASLHHGCRLEADMKRGLLSRCIETAMVVVVTAAPAGAQGHTSVEDRQFVFSVSTLPTQVPHATVQLDTGFGEGAFDVTDSDRPEQRLGVQAALGHRLTFLGRIGVSTSEGDVRSSQQGELLFSFLERPKTQGSFAMGVGMRHDSMGVNVLLGRIAAGRAFDAWRLDGNALFEKPFSTGRDAVDLITTFGVSRRLSSAVYTGVELIGEDLEGFWEVEEAEGGARLLIGPSLRIAPPAKRWQVSAASGPIIHATRSGRSSDAARGLPSSNGHNGYAVRLALSYGF
jgi:hypothetical protein